MSAGIRKTKFVSWIDPDRALESMKGSAWTTALKEEAAIAKKYTDSEDIRQKIDAYTDAARPITHTIYIVKDLINVTVENPYFKKWNFLTKPLKTSVEARDVIVSADSSTVVSVEEVGNGAEEFELRAYDSRTSRLLWTLKDVGDKVAVVGDRVFYTAIKNHLWNWGVFSVQLKDGKDARLVVEAAVPSENCGILREADGSVYASVEDSQVFKYYKIGADGSATPTTDPHKIPRVWKAPHGSYGVDLVWPSKGLLVTKCHGQKTLWHCGPSTEPKKLHEIPAGKIAIDPYVFHEGTVKPIPIMIFRPDMKPGHYRIVYNKNGTAHLSKIVGFTDKSNGLVCSRRVAQSLDGTAVHYIIVCSRKARPSRLLVTGYGAYGMESASAMIKERWGMLLDDGWAVVVGFIRGGGDHNEAWARAGRRSGRLKTWQDMEAVIRGAQRLCGIGPQHTCIYGRSAGGYLVGALLGRNPEGGLFRGVYTEVPYVDVLETTTNPGLPLTAIEYGEFGNPAANLEDLIFVGLTSPAVSAAVMTTPSIFVVARTAVNDSQVYAYETVKWIRRLRENGGTHGAPKITLFENGQGHFTPPDGSAVQYATDAALIDTLMK